MHLDNNLKPSLEKELQRLAQEKGEKVATTLCSIVLSNLDQGRVTGWLEYRVNRSPEAYVRLVAETYAELGEYLYRIQVERDEAEWQVLYADLQKWAYNYLLGKGFYTNRETAELAHTYATEAAMALLTARFPYDRDFAPWAHVLLLHICRREIRQSQKASRVPDHKKTSLDDELAHFHNPGSAHKGRSQELRLALLDAIERLPHEAWQQALLLRYIHNLTPKEIAEEMDKTASAIYNIQFKAMAALREIWHTKEHKYE